MIRVGFICDSFEVGGLEQSCLEVMRRLDRSRYRPYFYSFRPGTLLPEIERLDIPFTIGHDKPGADPTWDETDVAARARYDDTLTQRLAIDRIDVCLIYAWRDAVKIARKAGVSAMIERLDGPGLAGRVVDKAALDAIICESRFARQSLLAQRRLLGCRREQIIVIPNGIDLARFDPDRYDRGASRDALGIGATDFVIANVARLAPEKNLSMLLRAVANVVLKPDARALRTVTGSIRLVLAGPNRGCRAELETQARELGIADRVHFLGERSDVPEILRACDVFAITSLYEGVSIAMLEGIAMGLPIVATQVGALAECIDGNGILIAPLDAPSLSNAIVRLSEDPVLRRYMGQRSSALARRHDANEMVRAYESVIDGALSRSNPQKAALR